jgi:FlaA1/EpsC-like NDP-sugar epimerase
MSYIYDVVGNFLFLIFFTIYSVIYFISLAVFVDFFPIFDNVIVMVLVAFVYLLIIRRLWLRFIANKKAPDGANKSFVA